MKKIFTFTTNLNTIVPAIFILVIDSIGWAQAQAVKPFYEGKTIQIVVASGPGASTDIGARLVGRFLGKHVPGNPNTLVQNMPGAGGLVAANQIYNLAKPDGLTIVAVTRSNYLDQMVGSRKSDSISASSLGSAASTKRR